MWLLYLSLSIIISIPLAIPLSIPISILPSTYPSIYPSTYYSASIHSSIHPSTHPCIHPSLHPFLPPSVHPTINPSLHPSCLPASHLSIELAATTTNGSFTMSSVSMILYQKVWWSISNMVAGQRIVGNGASLLRISALGGTSRHLHLQPAPPSHGHMCKPAM